ncbi:YdcF family protein [Tateyamaria sp. syn59]|uniref:YdcF family protein n=1 Tax=Tateyamaria sp. syn59 TaxID=2576942 RepID=UPI0011BE95BC|nr:YdcF family protein [Tateyamaria sp. syn59]
MTETRSAALTLWQFHCVYDDLSPSDAIVGLGSYDLRVASHCADLYHRGLAPRIIFTGASGNWTRDMFQTTEAEAFREHAIQNGVPSHAITIEPHATNIGENMRLSATLLPDAKHIILVTKPQTQRRCQATALRQWPGIKPLVTAPATSFDDQPLAHHDARALICEMVGDIARMPAYAARGFQIDVPLPRAVQDAFDQLVQAGFTDHLPTDP